MKNYSSDTFKYYFSKKNIILIQKSSIFMKNYSSDTFKYYFSLKTIILIQKITFFHEKLFF